MKTNRKKLFRALLPALALIFAPALFAQDSIDQLNLKAQDAMDEQDYPLAIKYWSEVIHLMPKDATSRYNRAIAYQQSNDYDHAITDLTEALRLDPIDWDALERRAALCRRIVQVAVEQGKSDPAHEAMALGDYDAILRRASNYFTYYDASMAAMDMKANDKAVDYLTQWIQFDPKSEQAHQLRGITYYAMKQWDKSLADWNAAMKLKPDDFDNYLERSWAYVEKGDWKKGVADINEYLRHKPGDDSALSSRATAYAAGGQYDKALADFDSVLAKTPDDIWACRPEAWLLATCPDVKFRNGAKALPLAQKACALREDPRPEDLDTLAASEAETGYWDGAVKHEQQAIDAVNNVNEQDKKTEIAAYTARLTLYEKKQPYRFEKFLAP